MRFTGLTIRNFLSIGNAYISLDRDGVVLVSGSNGVGKSSIFEALLWCLYGVTARGLKGDEVINRWVGKDCLVRVQMTTDDDIPVEIFRFRKMGKEGSTGLEFIIDGTGETRGKVEDTQVLINEMMGLGPDAFLNSILCAQRRVAEILDMTDKEAKGVLDDMLDIGRFAKAQDRARVLMKEKEDRLHKIQDDAARTEESILDLTCSIASSTKAMEQWQGEHDKRVELAATRLGDAERELKKAQRTYEDEAKDDEDKDEFEDLLEDYLEVRGRNDCNLERAEREAGEIERLKTRIAEAKGGLGGDVDTTCPSCGQPLKGGDAKKLIEKEMVRRRGILDGLMEDKKRVEERVNKFVLQLEDLEKRMDGMTIEQLRSTVAEYREKQARLERLNREVEMANDEVGRAKTDLDWIMKEPGPSSIEGLIRQDQEKMKTLTAKLETIREEIPLVTRGVEQYRFWVDGFGPAGVRSRIIDSVLPFLNERLRYYAQKLTDGEIEVRFDTQKSLKSKSSVVDSFHIEVNNTIGGDGYKKQSGGEKKRIGLCAVMAFHDLVRNRYGKSLNISVFDEIFDELDDAGVERAISLINELGRGRAVFVISHNVAVKSSIDSHIEVRKDGNITEVVA